MNPLPLTRATLARNPFTVALFTGLIALAVALGIAISVQERALRQGSARAADRFDLIVAAPGSQVDVLLSTVFLRTAAVELLPGRLAEEVLAEPGVAFAAPIAFGDSHGASPVVGTTAAFVDHLAGGLAEGRLFAAIDEAVVGALVEAGPGARLAIRHGHADDLSGGADADSFADHAEGGEPDHPHGAAGDPHDHDEAPGHDDHDHDADPAHDDAHDREQAHDPGAGQKQGAGQDPSARQGPGAGQEPDEAHHHDAEGPDDAHDDDPHRHQDVHVVGRMPPTGTPWDRAVIVPVEYVWQAHAMGTGHPPGETRIGPPWEAAHVPGLPAIVIRPESVGAAYGLRARYRTAETMAFFPAETLVELYGVMGGAMRIMSALTLAAQVLVVAAILAGLLAVLDLQRRRFAVLRALGAPAGYIFLVVWLYVGAMILAGTLIGLPLGWLASAGVSALIAEATGVAMVASLGWREVAMAGSLLGLGLAIALLPAIRIYRQPVAEALR